MNLASVFCSIKTAMAILIVIMLLAAAQFEMSFRRKK
jgi:hypothetical protein